MPIRHVVSLLLLIVAPLILVGWLGTSTLARQRQQQRDQLRDVFLARIDDFDSDLQTVSQRYESTLLADLRNADRKIDALSEIRRRQPGVRSVLLVDRDGRLIFPAKPATEDSASRLWHAALTELARSRPVGEAVESSSRAKKSPTKSAVLTTSATRWQSWFHEGGLQLVLWLPRSDRTATGVVLERGRWMADMINALPDAGPEQGTYELRDGTDAVVYRWGQRRDDTVTTDPLAGRRLSPPWNAWRLTYSPGPSGTIRWLADGTLPLLATLLAIAITLALLGTYVLTSLRRQMKLASQRVNFASHVSHELRTPLTNIRLYAELAKRDLQRSNDASANAQAVTRLDVIEEESQRLSRIVSGVLDLVSGKGRLQTSAESPDTVVQRVADSFAPTYASLGIETRIQLDAPAQMTMDSDLVELVLVNLLSNVEKYAASGNHLKISTFQSAAQVTVDVIDSGPGISKSNAKRVFKPFERVDDSLSAPAGTGLGLSIARNAARRHGGDLELIASPVGAHFRFTFQPADAIVSKKVSV